MKPIQYKLNKKLKSRSPTPERPTIEFEKLTQNIFAVKYKNQTASKLQYTKEQVLNFLEVNNEAMLQKMSRYFFNVSGEYRRLVWYYSTIMTYDFLVIPKIRDEDSITNKAKRKKFDQSFQSILDYCDNSQISETNRFINLIVILDGVFYGYERNLDDTYALQQLPSEYCRSEYKIDGVNGIEFNFKFFDLYTKAEDKIKIFSQFPPEFLAIYNDWKAGKLKDTSSTPEWQPLNPEFARCHKLTELSSPLLSPIFSEIISLSEYKALDKTQTEMDLFKLIVQTLPTDAKTGLPLLKLPESQALHSNAKKMITQEGLDVLTTPLKVEAVNLQERGQTLRDNIDRAENNIFNAAGTSRLLFGADSKNGTIGLSVSVVTDEAVLTGLLDQSIRWYNNKFKYLQKSKNYSFEILMPFITRYNYKDKWNMWKEAATLGYSKLLPLVALGIKQSTFIDILKYENDILDLGSKMIPLQSAYNSIESTGRPVKDEGDLTDSGAKTKDTDANKNRAK